MKSILTKKKLSSIAKQARKKKDIGRKGKAFKRVAEKAAKLYGSEEAGKRVAAAAMYRGIKSRMRK